MIRWWISALQLTELFVSSLVHLVYGFYIFSTAVAADWFFKPNLDVGLKRDDSKSSNGVDDLPPIVLVHGIFGFGKGVCILLHYYTSKIRSFYIYCLFGRVDCT